MESPHPRKIRRQFYQVLGDPKFSRTSGGGLLKFVKVLKFSTLFFGRDGGAREKVC